MTTSDEDGGSSSETLNITVNNVAPTIVEISGATEVNQGETVQLSAIATDPGDDTLTYRWNFGDGSEAIVGMTATHDYTGNGICEVTLTVDDGDGGVTTDVRTITVNNVAPVIVELNGPVELNEGDTADFSAIATDIGNSALTYTWDFGDSSATADGLNASHVYVYADDGEYTATLTVEDEDGGVTTETVLVTVNNVAPTIVELKSANDLNALTSGSAISKLKADSEKLWSFEGRAGGTSTYEFAIGPNGAQADLHKQAEYVWQNGESVDWSLSWQEDTVVFTVAGKQMTYPTGDIATQNGIAFYTKVNTTVGQKVAEGTALSLAVQSINGEMLDNPVELSSEGPDSGQGFDQLMLFKESPLSTLSGTVQMSWPEDGPNPYRKNSQSRVAFNIAGYHVEPTDAVAEEIAPFTTVINSSTQVNEGSSITLSALATDPGDDTLTYEWHFGNGSEAATGETVEHTFADNGIYPVTLTVSDEDGGSTSEVLNITVNNVAPTIVEISGVTAVNEGEDFTLSAIASDPGADTLTYEWNFGDGSDPVAGEQAAHRFADNGIYTITLIVTDDDGGSTTETRNITVNNLAPEIIELTGSTSIEEGETITLSVIATDPGDDTLTYRWNFGDGAEAVTDSASVAHTFTDNGVYPVTLTVSDEDGGTTTQTLNITVSNVAPTIVEVTAPMSLNEGESITLSAIATDPGNDSLTYSWDFGDGADSIQGETVTHRYVADGVYTVTLLVRDDDGAVDIEKRTVTVNNVAPVITALSAPTAAGEGEGVTFSALATDAGSDALTYVWQFGDGTAPAIGQSAVHTFAEDGTYYVSLTVTDTSGAIAVQTHEITVNNLAPIVMAGEDQSAIEGQAVQSNGSYQDPGILDTHTVVWDFDDGGTVDSELAPTHTYRDQGDYTVTLSVTDDEGLTTTESLLVSVLNAPPRIVSLSGNTSVSEGAETVFTGFAVDPGADSLTYVWDFGDRSAAVEGATRRHTYADDGIYTVLLTVSDEDGGVATETLAVTVNNVAPMIASVASPAELGEGEVATFSATAADPGRDSLTFTWDFGDGSAAVTGQTVEHVYGDNGFYTATVTVTDEDGGRSIQTVDVDVHNIAPTATLSGNQRSLTGRAVSFEGGYSDPGVLDTHTVVWDFGDGTTAAGELNPAHTYRQQGTYTVTLTVTDDDGGMSTQSMTVEVTNAPPVIVAEGKVIIKGRNDFDGDPLNLVDDAYIYGGDVLFIRGKSEPPAYRDAQGRVLLDEHDRSQVLENAATVSAHYSQYKVPANRYGDLNHPRMVEAIDVSVPQHHDLVSDALMSGLMSGHEPISFNAKRHKHALSSASGWSQVFPAGGTLNSPTVVEITNGGLTIPEHVSLENVILIVKKGDINFRGNNNVLRNVTLITNNGKVDLSNVQSTNLEVFSSKLIKMGEDATFTGTSLLASQKAVTFSGSTQTERDRLRVISQGKIVYDAKSATRAQLLAGGDIVFRSGTSLDGGARAEGNITFNGKTTVRAVNDMPIVAPDKSLIVTEERAAIPLAIQTPVDTDGDSLTIRVMKIPDTDKGYVQLADISVVTLGQVLTLDDLQSLTFVATSSESGEASKFSYIVDDGWYTPAKQNIKLEIDIDSVMDDSANLCRVWRRRGRRKFS